MSPVVGAPVDGSPPSVGPGAPPPVRRTRNAPTAWVLIGIVAIALPARSTAAWLVGAESPLVSQVVTGVRIFRALLLLHAMVLPLLIWRGGRMPPGEPLAGSVRPRESFWPIGYGVLLFALVFGLALRLHDLGAGLWHDEIATLVEFGRLPLRRIVATYTAQNQHVLYSVLTSLTFSVFGESAWALRLPAALLGVASLAAVYWFGAIVTSRREALLATLLLTVSYHHVWFSQDARGYTGLMLFALVASGLFIRLLTGRSERPGPLVAGYAVVMALAVWTHLTAAFIAVAHFATWVVLAVRRRRQLGGSWPWAPLSAIVLAASLSLLLYSPVLPQMAGTLFAPSAGFSGETPWQSPLWLVTETLRGASRGLPGGWIGLAAAVVVALAGTVGYLRRSATTTTVLILPGLVTAGALVATQHNLWPRFFFFAAGFAVLIAVRGTFVLVDLLPLGYRRQRRLATAGLVLVTLASATTVPRAWAPKQDYAGALAWVHNERKPGDAVVAAGLASFAYERWLHADVGPVATVSDLDRIEGSHQRTWLIYTMPTHLAGQAPELWARIDASYREVVAFPGTVADGTVHVMLER